MDKKHLLRLILWLILFLMPYQARLTQQSNSTEKGCLICPSLQLSCAICKKDETCILQVSTCHECGSVKCISSNNDNNVLLGSEFRAILAVSLALAMALLITIIICTVLYIRSKHRFISLHSTEKGLKSRPYMNKRMAISAPLIKKILNQKTTLSSPLPSGNLEPDLPRAVYLLPSMRYSSFAEQFLGVRERFSSSIMNNYVRNWSLSSVKRWSEFTIADNKSTVNHESDHDGVSLVLKKEEKDIIIR